MSLQWAETVPQELQASLGVELQRVCPEGVYTKRATIGSDLLFEFKEFQGCELRLESEELWADRVTLDPSELEIKLRIWPRGTLRVPLEFVRGESIDTLEVFFEQVHSSVGEPAFSGKLACLVVQKEKVARCPLPAFEPLDLRLQSPSFLPLFLWGIRLDSRTPTQAPAYRPERGGLVAGWIRGPQPDQGSVAVWLERRDVVRANPADAKRLARAFQGQVSPRGFFEFRGVSPGRYRIRAKSGTLVGSRDLELKPEEVKILEGPLLLSPPLEFRVGVNPPLSPWGDRWVISLEEIEEGPIGREPLFSGPASEAGQWKAGPLEPGRYRLAVGVAEGEEWWAEELELAEASQDFLVELNLLEVEGIVSYRGNGVPCELRFGGRYSPRSISALTDAEGRFTVVLPEEGLWEVDMTSISEEDFLIQPLERVEVRRSPGGRPTRLEIRIPDTELAVRVITEEGEPVPGALVVAISLDFDSSTQKGKGVVQGRVGPEGHRRFRGIRPGTYALFAKSESARSDPDFRIEVLEGTKGPEVQLVLGQLQEFFGRVTVGGQSVPGAWVVVGEASVGGLFQFGRGVVTQLDGTFRSRVKVGPVVVLVYPPGLPVSWLRVDPGQASKPTEISLSNVGGTLILPIPPSAPPGAGPVVFHRGGGVGVRQLFSYVSSRLTLDPATPWFVLASVDPGEYLYCASLEALEQCERGFLPPGGTLQLGSVAGRENAP